MTARLEVLDDDTITNSVGNKLNGPGNNDYTAGEVYTIDHTRPCVWAITRANADPTSAASVDFIVTVSDNWAIDSTSLDGSDIRVTGPGGFNQLAMLVSVTPAGTGTPRTATYQITAPGGAWDSADSGTYTIAVQANQIFDTLGNAVAATSPGSFQVSQNYTVYLPVVVR